MQSITHDRQVEGEGNQQTPGIMPITIVGIQNQKQEAKRGTATKERKIDSSSIRIRACTLKCSRACLTTQRLYTITEFLHLWHIQYSTAVKYPFRIFHAVCNTCPFDWLA